jgi:hypothetical protein
MSLEEGDDLGGPKDFAGPDSYPAGSLYLEITGITNNLAHIIIHGTVPDTTHELLSSYLEQLFHYALAIGPNGVVTTNSAGTLSPYGEFFSTMPGPAALVTMPDLDTGQRGTGSVHVIKVELDLNHDGQMDLSFAGPDNTSQSRPFAFWVNDDHDEPAVGSKPDRDLPMPGSIPDFAPREIRSQRTLEDFGRLWICGVPSLPAGQGYDVTLTLNPISGSPAINLYRAHETNGGIQYLSSTNVAAHTVNSVLTRIPILLVFVPSDPFVLKGASCGTFRSVTPLRPRHSDAIRIPFRRCLKTVRISPGTLSELNRNSVRIKSEQCPNWIGVLSELRRNTHNAVTWA